MQTFHRSIILLLAVVGLMFSSCINLNPGEGDDDGLDKVAGVWYRVGSNNPGNDGLQVTVVDDQGTVTANPRNEFTIGSVKWRNIVPTGNETFDYEELGSDGNYYSASMVIDADTIRITIDISASGNQQKYVRESAYTEPTAETITLDCNKITSETTLVNSAAAVDYIVPSGCVLDVEEDLIIEPGTTIEFEENAGIGVYGSGSIKALGTTAQPITLRGSNAAKGYWRGIHIESNTFDNQFDHVNISDAGSNYVYCCNGAATIYLKGGIMSIKNTTLSNGENIGIYANKNTDLREYENITIQSHAGFPLDLDIERLSELDGTGSDYTGNDEDFAYVNASSMSKATTINELNVPYLFEGGIFNLKEDLEINEGVDIAFEEGGGIAVLSGGSFKVSGSSSNKVLIRGEESVRGFWRGIHNETNSSNNIIDHAVISDAGSNYVICCNTPSSIFLKDGKMAITNTKIENGASYGITARKAAEISDFANNQITTHDLNPMYIAAEQADVLDGENSDFQGNDEDFILFSNADVDRATDLPKNNVPYRLENGVVLDVKEPLSLKAGVEFVFSQNSGLGVYDNGTLSALGTASNPIIFRGAESIKGYWRGIHAETTSSNNIMENVELKDAGSNYVYCCNPSAGLYLKSGTFTVNNSTFADNDGCGISVNNNATLNESGNSYSNNTDGDVCN